MIWRDFQETLLIIFADNQNDFYFTLAQIDQRYCVTNIDFDLLPPGRFFGKVFISYFIF